jgi:hypothetical protein
VPALVAVLLGAACYEAAVALGALDVGPLPGDGPPGSGVVIGAAWVALVLAAGLVAVSPQRPLVWLLAPAAAALVVARFYSYDPYYAPARRRMSDGGAVDGSWVALLCVAAVFAAAAVPTRPRVGRVATVTVLLLSFATVAFEGAGH